MRRIKMSEFYFGHEKRTVYQKSLDLIEWINSKVLARLAKRDSVYDQLDRASTSTPLNIAEGNGKHTSKDKCRTFIQRGLRVGMCCVFRYS
jgi:hypothetical protein